MVYEIRGATTLTGNTLRLVVVLITALWATSCSSPEEGEKRAEECRDLMPRAAEALRMIGYDADCYAAKCEYGDPWALGESVAQAVKRTYVAFRPRREGEGHTLLFIWRASAALEWDRSAGVQSPFQRELIDYAYRSQPALKSHRMDELEYVVTEWPSLISVEFYPKGTLRAARQPEPNVIRIQEPILVNIARDSYKSPPCWRSPEKRQVPGAGETKQPNRRGVRGQSG